MATVAVAKVTAVYADDEVNGSDTFSIDIDVFIVGTTNFGSLGPLYQTTFTGLNPNSLSINGDIKTALKTNLVNNGVTFGLLDTVTLI